MIPGNLYYNFPTYNGPCLKFYLYHNKEIDLIYKDSTRSSTCGPNSVPTDGDFNTTKIGLLTHPKVKLVSNEDEADWIIFHSRNKVGWYSKYHLRSKITNPEKSIIIDDRDCAYKLIKDQVKFYFKRTILDKRYNKLQEYNQLVYNLPHCLRPQYENYNRINNHRRAVDVSVYYTLKDRSKRNKNRTDLANFIFNSKPLSKYNIHVGLIGTAGESGRVNINKPYFDHMVNSKIIITCTPNHNEGDYRLFEALNAGALVISDDIFTLRHLLIDNKHLYYYDKDNLPNLENNIVRLLKNDDLRCKIASAGYNESFKNHLAIDRANYIINIING